MFVTSISTSHVATVKSNLRHHGRGLNLGSSHLTEAFAHSIGFRTQAALLATLGAVGAPMIIEFNEDRFFERLSELSGRCEAELKSQQAHWPSAAFNRGVTVNDLRHSVPLSDQSKERLEKLFEMMAAEGVSFFQIKGVRPAYDPDALWFGSYGSGVSAMREAFLPPTPNMWDKKSWANLLAEDALDDSDFCYHELMEIMRESHGAFSLDLGLHDAIFSATEGLYINHDECEGFTRSVLFQRYGQLSDVMAADKSRDAESSSEAA